MNHSGMSAGFIVGRLKSVARPQARKYSPREDTDTSFGFRLTACPLRRSGGRLRGTANARSGRRGPAPEAQPGNIGAVERRLRSVDIVSWRCGVLAELDRSGLHQRVDPEGLDKSPWSADAGPGVVPEGGDEPGPIRGEEQVG